MAEYLPGILWLGVLLAGNAFFVGAEFAVISARRSQIEPRAAAGSRAARTTLWAMEHATLMLATSQLGITICSLLILTVSEPAIHHFLEYPLGLIALSPEATSAVAFVVALLLVTFLHVVLGEMVPKNLSFSVPDRAALLLAPPLVMVSRVFRPVIAALNWLANLALRAFGVEPRDEAASTFTLEEVEGIVEQSRREGTLVDESGTLARSRSTPTGPPAGCSSSRTCWRCWSARSRTRPEPAYAMTPATTPARPAKRTRRPARQARTKARQRIVEAPAVALTRASGGSPTVAETATAAGPPTGCESRCSSHVLTPPTQAGNRDGRPAWPERHRVAPRRDAVKITSFPPVWPTARAAVQAAITAVGCRKDDPAWNASALTTGTSADTNPTPAATSTSGITTSPEG